MVATWSDTSTSIVMLLLPRFAHHAARLIPRFSASEEILMDSKPSYISNSFYSALLEQEGRDRGQIS